jgi:hypothetical protein
MRHPLEPFTDVGNVVKVDLYIPKIGETLNGIDAVTVGSNIFGETGIIYSASIGKNPIFFGARGQWEDIQFEGDSLRGTIDLSRWSFERYCEGHEHYQTIKRAHDKAMSARK